VNELKNVINKLQEIPAVPARIFIHTGAPAVKRIHGRVSPRDFLGALGEPFGMALDSVQIDDRVRRVPIRPAPVSQLCSVKR
jgi:hypothetical protein